MDIGKIFAQRPVQAILRSFADVNPEKFFITQHYGRKDMLPKYRLASEKELARIRGNMAEKARKAVRQPFPYLKADEQKTCVLERFPELDQYDQSRLVFTDISPNMRERERYVVVREPNGDLRTGTQGEHDRMMRVYYPRPYRYVKTPEIFLEELPKVLSEGKHAHVLDFACCQFEPDDPNFVRVRDEVFNDLLNREDFDLLCSTRHYPVFVFHALAQKNYEGLVRHYSLQKSLDKIVDLVKLYRIVWENTNFEEGVLESDVVNWAIENMELSPDCRKELNGVIERIEKQ